MLQTNLFRQSFVLVVSTQNKQEKIHKNTQKLKINELAVDQKNTHETLN